MEDIFGIEDVLVKPSAQKRKVRRNLALDYLDGEIHFPAEALQGELGFPHVLPRGAIQ